MAERLGAVVLAAGCGRRMHTDLNKPYLRLGDKPLLYYSLQRLARLTALSELVVVVREADRERLETDLLGAYRWPVPLQVALGGPERQDSALAGLAALVPAPDLVLIHDGVRPFFSSQLAERVVETAREHRAALPGLAVQETIRPLSAQGGAGPPLERERLVISQTPQCYEYRLVYQALRDAGAAGRRFSDEAGAVLAMTGLAARVIPGEPQNLKITTPEELELARALIGSEQIPPD